MMSAKMTSQEQQRLSALRELDILDTPREVAFDRLTEEATRLCHVPIALISLVAEERQWFKSGVGLCLTETTRDVSFCSYTIQQDGVLVIEDTSQDPRTKDNPFVLHDPNIRFYAGAPIKDRNGFAVGSLCVLDLQPRSLSQSQLEGLQKLAHKASSLLENRRKRIARTRQPHWVRKCVQRWGAVALTFSVSMSATTIAYVGSRRAEHQSASDRFERLAERATREISRRANLPVYGLKGGRGVFAASRYVERVELEAYVRSRNLKEEFPGVLGIGFVKRVTREGERDFVIKERADRAPRFHIAPFPNTQITAQDSLVVTSIFPESDCGFMWGVDLGSEPVRRAAIEAAVRTGESSISAPIDLRLEGTDRRGYLFCVPVYLNGSSHSNESERFAALDGILYAPVHAEAALAGIVQEMEGNLDFAVLDGAPSGLANLLFSTWRDSNENLADISLRYATESSIQVGGRLWTVKTRATPRFISAIDHSTSILSAVSGSFLSVLLALLVWSLSRSKERAYKLADQMTSDLSAARDIAVQHSKDLKASSDMLRRTGHMAQVGGWELDVASGRLSWSDEVYRIHEVPLGSPVDVEQAIAFYAPESRALIRDAVAEAMRSGKGWDLELPLVTVTGRRLYVRAQGECVFKGGQLIQVCGAFQDITQRKTAEEQLRRTATHDKLTGLPNRAMLTDHLARRLERFMQSPDRPFAVLFMDFDRFKLTNDTLGHEAGDELLRQIAGRLRACLHYRDAIEFDVGPLVSRLGGDEFVVVLNGSVTAADVLATADRLLECLSEPYQIGDHEVVSTASIGVVVSDVCYTRSDEMLRDADIAMYEAKAAGKGRYVLFDTRMRDRLHRRVQLEADLRKAAANHELYLKYQPIVCLQTAETQGVEALLRWEHPTLGPIRPDELIPIAEDSGFIIELGEWVLREACAQFVTWQTTLGSRAPKHVCVNLSRKQLAVGNLHLRVKEILAAVGMDPKALQLEVTETTVMKDPRRSTELLTALRQLGTKICMDDFGTGHSSLAMLHQFPIDVLKIDRTFISNLEQGRQFAALVSAIGQLGRNLNMQLVAEGVEHADQVAMLQAMECEFGQGYFFGHPMTAAQCERFINTTTGVAGTIQDASHIAAA